MRLSVVAKSSIQIEKSTEIVPFYPINYSFNKLFNLLLNVCDKNLL